MKKIAILFCLLLTGCQVTHIPRTSTSFIIDFAKYSNSGFLFTPDGYSGKFKTIAQISVTIYPAAYQLPSVAAGTAKPPKGYYQVDNYAVEKLDPAYIVDSVYTMAKNMGADCIMNFSIHTVWTKSSPILTGYEVSGFAVKRE